MCILTHNAAMLYDSLFTRPGSLIETYHRYKHIFHPEIGHTLCFLGFARPTGGGVPATAELGARYFVALLKGDCKVRLLTLSALFDASASIGFRV